MRRRPRSAGGTNSCANSSPPVSPSIAGHTPPEPPGHHRQADLRIVYFQCQGDPGGSTTRCDQVAGLAGDISGRHLAATLGTLRRRAASRQDLDRAPTDVWPVLRGPRRGDASGLADYWAADALAELGATVHLAHPLGVKAFSYRRVKNDQRDAADLADLLRMGRLPHAWIAPPETRELRELVRHRAKLVAMRSRVQGPRARGSGQGRYLGADD